MDSRFADGFAHTREVLGNKWSVEPWTGRNALRMQARILNTFGKNGAQAISGDMEALAVAIQALVSLNPEQLVDLALDLTRSTQVNGEQVTELFFDKHFKANISELIVGIAWILRVNFGEMWGKGLSGNRVRVDVAQMVMEMLLD